MRNVKLDYYEVEIPYTGNFEDVDEVDLFYIAKSQVNETGKGYQYSDYVEPKVGGKLDGEFTVENTDPEHRICTVFWSELDEEFDGRTEEERDYDAYCHYMDMLTDRERGK